MPIELKATAELDHKFNDAAGKPLPHPITTLTIKGELLPPIPIQHHILSELLNEKNPPKVDVQCSNVNGLLTFSVTFEHEDDVIAAGKEAHDLAVEAANFVPPITVEQLVAKKAAAKAAREKAEQETAASKE
jgi:hypothetical protein